MRGQTTTQGEDNADSGNVGRSCCDRYRRRRLLVSAYALTSQRTAGARARAGRPAGPFLLRLRGAPRLPWSHAAKNIDMLVNMTYVGEEIDTFAESLGATQ